MRPFDENERPPIDRHGLHALISVGVALLVGVLAWNWLAPAAPVPSASASIDGYTLLDPPKPIPSFRLAGERPLTEEALRGQWTLLSIGFASCPDICPNTLSVTARAAREASKGALRASVLFVSVDPERDTAETLTAWARHFGPHVRAATGTHEALSQLTTPLGLFYQRAPGTGNAYSVEHSSSVLLVDPELRVVAVFGGADLDPTRIARVIEELAS